MKTLLTTALTLCLLIAVGCAEGNTTTPEAQATIANATNKVEANIEGMDCSGCEASVVAAVKGIDGVTEATADVATGDVKVAFEDGVDTKAKQAEVEKVLAELEKGKYTVKTISATSSDAAKGGDEADANTEDPAVEEPAADEQAGTEGTEEAFVFTSYKVTGMDCSGCSSQIVKAVEQVDGVKTVEADHMTGAVKVAFEARFDDKVKTEEIKGVIAGLSEGKYTVSY